jgi:hypothetical protein
MARLTRDLAVDKQHNPALNETWEEEEEDVDDDGEDNIIDRCESPWRKFAALVYGTLGQPKALGRENTSTSPDKRGNGATQIGLGQPD